MDSLELSENVCRICLDYNVLLNWNIEIYESSGISYKDCYYKYIKLSESDSEHYPTNLCEMCANELKNAHMLFEKALESFNILRVALTAKYTETEYSDMKASNGQLKMQSETDALHENNSIEFNVESPIDDKSLVEIQDEICLSPVRGNEILLETESAIESADAISISEDASEQRHFIVINNFESSDETLLQQKLIKSSNSKSPKLSTAKKAINKRKKYKPSSEQFNESCDTDLPKSSTSKNSDQLKIYKSTADPLLEQALNESCDTKSSVPSTTKRSKPREKLCQYCSLKVNGTNHLRTHEATHSENRERKHTCPQCGIKLYTKLTLSEHMKIHNENRQKNHKCEFCEKAFFNKGALNVHRRIHLGLMVKCQICLKEYFRQVDLNKHLQTHSAASLQKNVEKFKYTVQCQYCNKSVQTNKWKAHKAEHLNQPQMKCKICDKIFFSRTSCTSHLRKTHRKREYDKFIYYYVDSNSRMSHLMIRQQEEVQALTK